MSKPRRRHDASRLAFGETVRHSALEGGHRVEAARLAIRQRRTRHWLKFKNSAAPAVKLEKRKTLVSFGQGFSFWVNVPELLRLFFRIRHVRKNGKA
jgi:hypothetical protein